MRTRSRAVELATEVIAAFSHQFDRYWLAGMRGKLGLFTEESGDLELVRRWLELLHRNQCDYTLSFRRLCDAARADGDAALRSSFAHPVEYEEWAAGWRSRLAREPQSEGERAAAMRRVNPAFIPRNHRIERVIAAAVEREDFAPFEEMLLVLSQPYQDQSAFESYAAPPQPEERVLQTFCGT